MTAKLPFIAHALPECIAKHAVEYTIRYRRPETPYGLGRMVVPATENAARHIQRLKALGYTIELITPPFTGEPSDDAAPILAA